MVDTNSKIYLSPPHMCGEEIKFVNNTFADNWIAPLGPNVDGLEQDINKYLNCKNTVALSSGTAAIHLALILIGIKPGDVVLVSSFSFCATVNPVIYLGATPVFIDSEKDTWNMDPELLEIAIIQEMKKNTKPKAVICVDLYGMPAKLDMITNVCKKYDIPLIEDSAEALGSKYKNKKCGGFGKFGILSFNGNKIITTSGGGALICPDHESARKALFLATQARDDAPHYQHSEIGYNYRLSNVLAGVGRGQMSVIQDRVDKRRSINNYYRKALSQFDFISFQNEPDSQYFSNFWLTCILINANRWVNREELRLEFEKNNIESRPLWKPLHLQPVFKNYKSYSNKTCEKIFKIGLCLPSGSSLSDNDLERILKIFNKTIK